MAFGQMPFPVRQAIGEWAERTVIHYFSETGRYHALRYGERWSGKKRVETDAVNRPDLLLLSKEAVERLKQNGIDPLTLELKDLSDHDKRLVSIVDEATVALETKISFRYYQRGHVNFIVDEVRKKRYEVWLTRTRKVGCLVIWFTLDKAFIAPMNLILSEGKAEDRSYESYGRQARIKTTYNYPVEQAERFADVNGVRLNETLRPVLTRGQSGSISIIIEDDPGILKNVNLEAFERLTEQVKRHVS